VIHIICGSISIAYIPYYWRLRKLTVNEKLNYTFKNENLKLDSGLAHLKRFVTEYRKTKTNIKATGDKRGKTRSSKTQVAFDLHTPFAS